MKNNNTAKNGSFVKPTTCFSQISNEVLQDPFLSLRAKGLFSLIASFITLPNFTLYKNYIKNQCSEGKYAFDTAWKELQDTGYLTHTRVRQHSGTFGYEYTLALPQQKRVTDSQIEKTTLFSKDVNSVPTDISKTKKPTPEKQVPVHYIYNNTQNNNTKSVRQMLEKQIEYQYFVEDVHISNTTTQIISLLLDFLIEQCNYKTFLSLEIIENIDSCTILEFLEHMKSKKIPKLYNPSAYWKMAFCNYLKESPLHLAVI